MMKLEKQLSACKVIIQKSTLRVVCPQCLQGFPRADFLYRHFKTEGDDIHKGLSMRKVDFKKFLDCYQEALGALVPAEKLRYGFECFEVMFVVEHYANDAEKVPMNSTSQSSEVYETGLPSEA
ncbi:uncharacterized protein ACLA_091470 [Aspergillus clavatus NRRL 1]|uniref:Uncharacterized protein n=1 Tax=Aspergillus clavatus (strain ATCC 1007 / CBS 513.65 / DSM 816 / NCTC 3887 / NRRL 1 / QM 1276 / 107) TaxID=344612 RepID=A1CF00_ASPCL|nr:uncharacterized protein ACLA_091470 [Aspergillus clavatus NRRL 1]EAW11449.1 hypothetical protein ACLA_091470 [Aspergillus clavatus NRRL 1]